MVFVVAATVGSYWMLGPATVDVVVSAMCWSSATVGGCGPSYSWKLLKWFSLLIFHFFFIFCVQCAVLIVDGDRYCDF